MPPVGRALRTVDGMPRDVVVFFAARDVAAGRAVRAFCCLLRCETPLVEIGFVAVVRAVIVLLFGLVRDVTVSLVVRVGDFSLRTAPLAIPTVAKTIAKKRQAFRNIRYLAFI